jgi:outer membrane lipoprotein carrier protein
MKALLLLLPLSLLLLAPAAVPQDAVPPTAAEVARSVQARYEQVRDFSADFVQSYTGGVLGEKVTEQGTVLIKKPGKMRWTYTSPERKIFVSDGVNMYSYVPEDRQVIVTPVAPSDETTPTLFLAGKGDITRDFVVSYTDVGGAPEGTLALNLVPTRHETDYNALILVVDRKTYGLRMLITTDQQGGQSTFTFSKLKENIRIPDSEFVFKIPRGVEVIRQDAR